MLRQWTTNDIPDLSGKNAVVTGANSGLGFEIALELAKHNCAVIMACRDQTRGEAAREKILALAPGASVTVEILDLADFASIRAFSQRLSANNKSLSLLVNNAGAMNTRFSKTKDGHEANFQTNYLGPFLLTTLLYPLLHAATVSRIVCISSITEKKGRIEFDNLDAERKFDANHAYANSKLALLQFSFELHRRLQAQASHVMSLAAHPGYAATNILGQHKHSAFKGFFIGLGDAIFAQSAAKGAISALYASVGAAHSGEYYAPDGFKEFTGNHPALTQASKHAYDADIARQLWALSEKATGIAFLSDAELLHAEYAKPQCAL